MLKPEPVSKNVVCSVCGLLWSEHVPGEVKAKDVTLETCVRLLKAALAKRPLPTAFYGGSTIQAWPMAGRPIN